MSTGLPAQRRGGSGGAGEEAGGGAEGGQGALQSRAGQNAPQRRGDAEAAQPGTDERDLWRRRSTLCVNLLSSFCWKMSSYVVYSKEATHTHRTVLARTLTDENQSNIWTEA